MSLSGSFNFTVTAANVIQGALEKINVVQAGESVDSDDQSLALRELNGLVKQWAHPADGAPGMAVWLRKLVYLFLTPGTREYSVGRSGSRCTEDYHTTTLDAAEALGQTTLSVAATTDMANSDIIGIELDDGTIQWSTVSSFVANDTVTVADALTGAAASGNRVFYYTPVAEGVNSVAWRPQDLLNAQLYDPSTGIDTPVTVYKRMERNYFDSVADKTTQEDPSILFFEPMLSTSKITLERAAADGTKVLKLNCLSTVDDLDATTDDLNFPPEWNMALQWELAKRLVPAFGAAATWSNISQENWLQATNIARSANMRGFEDGYMAEDAGEDSGTL